MARIISSAAARYVSFRSGPVPGLKCSGAPKRTLTLPGRGSAAPRGMARPLPGDVHGHHRRPAQHREHPRARLGLAQDALGAPGALGKHQQRAAFLEHAQRVLEGARVAAPPPHRAGVDARG